MAGLFPPDAVVRRVNLEPAVGLGAGRALLLQLAHPAVAQGVHDHSAFKRNPFSRLQATLEAVVGAVFGDVELARAIGHKTRWVHEFVTGPGYRALDHENLLWVHATLVDTALVCYDEFLGPLPDSERESYYAQMMEVAELFGCPREAQPPTYAAFRRYFDAQVAVMEPTSVGRELAAFIVEPALPLGAHVPLRPLLRFLRLLSVGLLPPRLREELGFTWTDRDAARFDAARRRLRALMRACPRSLRTAPGRINNAVLLRQARRHVNHWQARHAPVEPAS